MKGYKTYQIVAIVIGLFLCFFGRYIPVFDGLSPSGTQTLFIMIGGLLMWLLVGVDWTSMAVIFSMALIPEVGMGKAAAGSLGNGLVFYLMLCFMLAESLKVTGVAHRLAVWFLTCDFSRKGAWHTIAMIFTAIFVLSSGLSSSATIMIFLPILYEIIESLGYTKGDDKKLPAVLIASLPIVCQVAQSTTPISHAMTLIGFSQYSSYTGQTMDFGQYVMVALPMGILVVIAWFLISKYLIRPDTSRFQHLNYEALRGDLGEIKKEEKIAAGLYILVIFFWLAPELSKYITPSLASAFGLIQQCYPPIVALILLNFISVGGKPVLSYKDALKGAPIGMLLFMGALLELGSVFANKQIGISAWMSTTIGSLCDGISPVMFIILITIVAVIGTNFMSNAVTCAVCMSIAMPLVSTIYQGAIDPFVMAVMITMGINYAFATAPATPPVAIVAGSGWIKTSRLFNYGMAAAVVSLMLLFIVGLQLAQAIV